MSVSNRARVMLVRASGLAVVHNCDGFTPAATKAAEHPAMNCLRCMTCLLPPSGDRWVLVGSRLAIFWRRPSHQDVRASLLHWHEAEPFVQMSRRIVHFD